MNEADAKLVTSSGTLKTSPGLVYAYLANHTGGNGTITFRDGGSSGTVRWQLEVVASEDNPEMHTFPIPIRFKEDIYITIADNAEVSVVYG